MGTKDTPELWPGQKMALFLGISDRRLRALVDERVIQPTVVTSGGRRVRRYDPIATNIAYREYAIKNAVKRAVQSRPDEADVAELQKQKLAADAQLSEARLVAQTYINDMNSGKLVWVENVEREYRDFMVVLRKFVLAIPARVTGMLSGSVEAEESRRISAELKKELTDLLGSFVVSGKEKLDEEA